MHERGAAPVSDEGGGPVPASTDTRAPFVIGVTGHRDLGLSAEGERVLRRRLVAQVFGALLRELREQGAIARARAESVCLDGSDPSREVSLPLLSDTPIVLLTGLAEGGDRFVTRVARQLDRWLARHTSGRRRNSVHVVPVLPMGRALYEATFSDRDGRGEFGDALSEAGECVFEMPAVASDEVLADPGPLGESARKLQYGLAGLFIARWSRLVVALWDGVEYPTEPGAREARRGGTSHVVHMALTGRIDDPALLAALAGLDESSQVARMLGAGESLMDLVEPAPVLWFPVRLPRVNEGGGASRAASDRPADAPGTTRLLRPTAFLDGAHVFDRYLRETFERLSACNAELVRVTPHQLRSSARLVDEGTPSAQEVRYHAANLVAMRHAARSLDLKGSIHVLIGVSALGFLGYAHLGEGHAEALAGLGLYLVLLAVADAVFQRARSERTEHRHWDVRALAEGLRVSAYWRLAGLVRPVSRLYLRRQRSELDWIRFAMDGFALRDGSGGAPRVGAPTRARVVACWLGQQFSYYADRAERRHETHERFEFASAALLLLSIVVALVEFVHEASPLLAVVLATCAVPFARWHARRVIEHVRHRNEDALDAERARARRQQGSAERGRGDLLDDPLATGVLVFVVGGLAMSALMAFGRGVPGLSDDAHDWQVSAMVVPAIIAALIHSYAAQRAVGAEQGRFFRMQGVYARAIAALTELAERAPLDPLPERESELVDLLSELIAPLLPESDGRDDLRAIAVLEAVGEESLSEHAEWVMLHRDHPLDLPHAQ